MSDPNTDWSEEALSAEIEIHPAKPLTTWTPKQFLAWTEPPGNHLLLPAYVTRGELTTWIGQGGLGKSRLVGLWLPIAQILGWDFCGLKTGGDPQVWLYLGNENSLARIKFDLSKIFTNLSSEQQDKVDSLLHVQAITSFEDMDLNLGDAEIQGRIEETIKTIKPGGIVADPLNSFAPDDISKPGPMKEAVRLLVNTCRRSAPEAAVNLCHHSRPGRLNILQSVGFDAANFGAGGKVLFGNTRCQINLAPASETDDTKILMACAKSNNCLRFETRGLAFNPDNFTYAVDPDFDLDRWKAEVEGKTASGKSLCTVADVVSCVRDGYASTKDICTHLMDAFCASKSTVERLIKKAVDFQGIKPLTRGKFIIGRKAANFLNETI